MLWYNGYCLGGVVVAGVVLPEAAGMVPGISIPSEFKEYSMVAIMR